MVGNVSVVMPVCYCGVRVFLKIVIVSPLRQFVPMCLPKKTRTQVSANIRRPPLWPVIKNSRNGVCCGASCVCRQPKSSQFHWLWGPWATTELEFVRRAGLDGYLLYRTLRLLMIMTVVLALAGFTLLVPVYVVESFPCEQTNAANLSTCVKAVNEHNESCSCGFLAQTSLTAGVDSFNHQIAAVVVQFVVSVIFFSLLAHEFKYWMKVRRSHCETAPPQIYTVMVRFIPEYLRTESRLRQFFEDLYVYILFVCLLVVGLVRVRSWGLVCADSSSFSSGFSS